WIQYMQQDHEWVVWRRHLHQLPEIAYQETATSAYLRKLLARWGLALSPPLAGTGFIAQITKGSSEKSIALRTDMDALPLQESSNLPWASRNENRFHACGHDGHMAMLLGVGQMLKDLNFDGTVNLIFQPAEEGKAGAKRMIQEGL